MSSAHQSGSQNQTLLELIYAMKSLAQQVEFYHQDMSRRFDEESRARRSDVARILDLNGSNLQAVSVLPITLSDRVEKLLSRVEIEMGDRIDNVKTSIEEVRRLLYEYSRTTDRAISHNEAVAVETKEKEDITGRIELTEEGEVRVRLNSRVLKKIWYGVIVIATGGGAYGFVELVKRLLNGE